MDKKDYGISIVFLVRTTGLPPVAALADKQSAGLFGPTDKLLAQFSPYFKSRHPYKQKRHNHKGCTSFVGADDGI